MSAYIMNIYIHGSNMGKGEAFFVFTININ